MILKKDDRLAHYFDECRRYCKIHDDYYKYRLFLHLMYCALGESVNEYEHFFLLCFLDSCKKSIPLIKESCKWIREPETIEQQLEFKIMYVDELPKTYQHIKVI